MGFMDEVGNGPEEEKVRLRNSSQARSESGLWIVIEVLNCERGSLPRIGMGILEARENNGKMRYLEVCKIKAWLFVV